MDQFKTQLRLAQTKTSPVRAWMVRRRLLPLSPVGKFFWRCLAVAVALNLLTKVTGTHGLIGGFVAVLSALAYVVAVPVGCYIFTRWLLTGILWRLRNRLVVTYLFIGGAPLLLVMTLALVAAYFMSGQFAAYIAMSDLHQRLDAISVENAGIAAHIAGDTRLTRAELADVPELKSADPATRRVIEIFEDKEAPVSSLDARSLGKFTRPTWLKQDFKAIVGDAGRLYFRSARSFSARGHNYTVISSEPLDAEAATAILSGLGEIDLYGSGLVGTSSGDFVAVDEQDANEIRKASQDDKRKAVEQARKKSEAYRIHVGSLPAQINLLDRTLHYISPLPVTEWDSGKEQARALSVTTRPSVLYNRLFSASTVWGTTLRNVLFGTAVFFGFLEIFALFIGMRLTRSVTHAVHELYNATLHIEQGDLSHRIRVRSNDQLAALEGSFNQMSESLGKLLQEQREKERLQNELAIAQQVQEQLFPRAWTSSRYLDLFGVCRPARAVSGDYYDFVSLTPTRTLIAMGDISGKGISAALLMATIQSAVRSYELDLCDEPMSLSANAGGSSALMTRSTQAVRPPSETMRLLNRHLYRSTPPEKYATLFLGLYDGESRTLSYTNGGHLPPIVVRRDGSIEALDVSGTVIGLFEDMVWEQSHLQLSPGDMLIAYSDGMTEPENEFGEFGEERLIDMLRQNRGLPLEEIARRTLTSVQEWIGENEQPDDMTVVLARPTT